MINLAVQDNFFYISFSILVDIADGIFFITLVILDECMVLATVFSDESRITNSPNAWLCSLYADRRIISFQICCLDKFVVKSKFCCLMVLFAQLKSLVYGLDFAW